MSAAPSSYRLVEDAARLLAAGEHDVRQRLLSAYVEKLQYVRPAELPGEVAPQFASILRRFGAKHASAMRASVESTLKLMDTAAAVKLAADIFELNCVLSSASYH